MKENNEILNEKPCFENEKMYLIEIVHKKIWVSIFVVIEKYGIVALNLRQTKV